MSAGASESSRVTSANPGSARARQGCSGGTIRRRSGHGEREHPDDEAIHHRRPSQMLSAIPPNSPAVADTTRSPSGTRHPYNLTPTQPHMDPGGLRSRRLTQRSRPPPRRARARMRDAEGSSLAGRPAGRPWTTDTTHSPSGCGSPGHSTSRSPTANGLGGCIPPAQEQRRHHRHGLSGVAGTRIRNPRAGRTPECSLGPAGRGEESPSPCTAGRARHRPRGRTASRAGPRARRPGAEAWCSAHGTSEELTNRGSSAWDG